MKHNAELWRNVRKIIGHNIHTRRRRKGMSLRNLAKRSGLSEETLDLYEVGANNLDLRELICIASAMNTDLRWLVENTNLQNPEKDQATAKFGISIGTNP